MHRELFEQEMVLFIGRMGPKTPLREACEYALMSGGKRFRPLLVLLIAEALGQGLSVMPAALGVECFHTASLIADDLPCMDNDAERRKRPSLHKRFGEDVAILASYTLIAAGYEGIASNGRWMGNSSRFALQSAEATLLALEVASRCAGILGATQGQYWDLHPSQITQEFIEQVIDQKTTSLFEVAFVWGWLFGGGEIAKLSLVQECAAHLGRAFQIGDDLQDQAKDRVRGNPLNLALACGEERAVSLFEQERALFQNNLKALHLDTPALLQILSIQEPLLVRESQ